MPYGNARTLLYFRWRTNTYNASRSRRPVEELIWKHPPEGIFKLNVDEATSLKGLSRGVRIVIRDENGVLMVGCSKQIHGRFDALTTELLAAKERQVFAYVAGFHAIICNLTL
ncbi:hypothetical protein ACFX19_045394 [Malus domestica]